MQFLIKDLKFFLQSINKNNINQIYLKSNKLEITINKQNYFTNKFKNNHIIDHLQTNNESIAIKKKSKKDNQNKINLQPVIKVNIDQNESQIYSTIISPMVGTFYQSSAPNEPPFIKKGDFVEKKQIVCIIEAMKLMNEIEAEVTGEIVEILVNDGDIVDCGQALMKVKL
uniref:acetyl-CoA carboxylase biotin carboxyl carrier protein n=1 Tax=Campylaephora boydenii TaxID=202204 RepID=UPI002551D7D0|nr:acetyl-CoA carboxylase biotin carboxyl carrier protein [Campylaephora boydenii]WGT74131.1 acetyl-CoA carboxylase biotin carboxyl carrier protein [Campylaephora boydenii]